MLLQIHFLTSYHASLLNRDDVGLAKRIDFGGLPRLRVSSQCQKRHWREWMIQHTTLPRGFRTRHFFDRILVDRLSAAGMDERVARDLAFYLMGQLLKASKNKEAAASKKGSGKRTESKNANAADESAETQEELVMSQAVLFGEPEADYFVRLICAAAAAGDIEAGKAHIADQIEREKPNFQALLKQAGSGDPTAGFEGAMFGRFVTSDILARVDAPVHVAHAFTTHALDTEVDFFTVVDDLAGDETGAAHVNDMELGTGIFYGYVVVDVPLLISNLTGCNRKEWTEQDASDARQLLSLLIRAIAEVSPGAKLGATAPYAKAECVVLEVGDKQPRSLANAFLKPIDGHRRGRHPMGLSIEAMAEYMGALDEMYGDGGERRFLSLAPIHRWPRENEAAIPLQAAIDQALAAIFGERQ